VGAVVLTAVLATSCARPADTSEVSADGSGAGARLATSTTLAQNGGASVASARTSRSGSGAAGNPELAETAQKLIAQIASDPTLAAQLVGADQAALARLTGLDAATLERLQITPSTVRALATILTGVDADTLQRLAGARGELDPALAATILGLAAQLDPGAAASIRGVDPRAVAVLLGTASTVDPRVVDSLGAVLGVVDPNGLGRFAGNKESLAILAVLFGAALRTDPAKFGQLANINSVDPAVNFAINGIRNLALGLTPTVVNQLNGISRILGPDLLRALSAVIGLLGRPDIAPVIQAAAADPLVIVTTLGAASLLVPGLAEALAPDTFGNNPEARYAALLGLVGVAIANIEGLDLNALAVSLGLPPLPADFGR
jgi:hypothetical protein